jgi:hypothetical protein
MSRADTPVGRRRGRGAPEPLPKLLVFFAIEQSITKESALWPQIATLQREGLVSLRWSDTSAYCHVKLTEKGAAEAKRRQDAGELT